MFQNLDEALMTFVNGLSVFVFFAIVGYHYITVSACIACCCVWIAGWWMVGHRRIPVEGWSE